MCPRTNTPIDDPRYRGRLVGEIHLDHARVTYTKDRFDRNDPAWDEMIQTVRGEGPIRPDKAQDLGYGINTSPLSLLFQAFRRSSPQRRVAGGYARLLIVPDNDRALEMARRFHSHEPEYQSDMKWYDLVEEADHRLLTDTPSDPPSTDPEDLAGFTDPTDPDPTVHDPTQDSPGNAKDPPHRVPLSGLTREYVNDTTSLRWNIEAFRVSTDDPDLGGDDQPWKLLATPQGEHQFLVNDKHVVFQSATMTPLDALLAEIAWLAMDYLRGQQGSDATFAFVLAELRDRYATTSKLHPAALSVAAATTLTDIGRSLQKNIPSSTEGLALFAELSPSDQDEIQHRMAVRMVSNPQSAIAEGGFLEYAPFRTLLSFFQRHPEFFLDGRYWDTAYDSLDYGTTSATDEARARIIHYYLGLLSDVAWLAEQTLSDFAQLTRGRLLRTSLALELLAPSIDID